MYETRRADAQDEVQVAQASASKPDGASQAQAQPQASGDPSRARARADVPWTVPEGWNERANTSQMRFASYGVTAADGRSVDISVVVLGENPGTELENVNRWRQQLRLSPIEESEVRASGLSVKIGQETAWLWDIESEELILDEKHKARTLAALLNAGVATVFFKAYGESALVAEQKPKFIAWLNSVVTGPPSSAEARSSGPAPSAGPSAGSATASGGGEPRWEAPAHWSQGGPRPMRHATYEVEGAAGAKGDLSISSLGGDGGGILNNVNRWRRQIGLAPWTEEQMESEMKVIETSDKRSAILVSMTGNQALDGQARSTGIAAAMIPVGGQTWFFKLTGDAPLIAAEATNFEKFIQSVQF